MTILNEINDQLSNEIDDLNAFLKKVTTTERYVGYSNSDDPEEVKFYITVKLIL